MKHIIILLTTLLVAGITTAQNDSLVYEQDHHTSEENFLPYVKIGVGTLLPQGDLQNYFDSSPLFELAFDFPSYNKKRGVEAVIQFAIPQQNSSFIFQNDGSSFRAEASTVINGFLRFKKFLWNKERSHLEIGAGLGISSIFIDTIDIENQDLIDYESSNSFLFIPGVAYVWDLKDESKLHLALDMQYAPYKIEGALDRKIGNIAIIPKISYRF